MRATVLVVVVLLGAVGVAGCGSDDGGGGTTTQESGASAPVRVPEDPTEEALPTRRDREAQSDLERHLKQEAAIGGTGWTYADIQRVRARGSQVVITTKLSGRRGREAATSLCLAAQGFFADRSHSVFVTGGGAGLARC